MSALGEYRYRQSLSRVTTYGDGMCFAFLNGNGRAARIPLPKTGRNGCVFKVPKERERRQRSTIQQSIYVNAPIRNVYSQWTQFEEFPLFMAGILEVRQLDDKRSHCVQTSVARKK